MITVRGQILVSRTDDDPLPSVCGFNNASVCMFKTSPCVPATRPRVKYLGFEVRGLWMMMVFLRVFDHQQHTPHNTTKNITRRQRETEKERQRKREKTREDDRHKTRRQEKMKEERRDKRRQEKTRREKMKDKGRAERRLEERRSKTR